VSNARQGAWMLDVKRRAAWRGKGGGKTGTRHRSGPKAGFRPRRQRPEVLYSFCGQARGLPVSNARQPAWMLDVKSAATLRGRPSRAAAAEVLYSFCGQPRGLSVSNARQPAWMLDVKSGAALRGSSGARRAPKFSTASVDNPGEYPCRMLARPHGCWVSRGVLHREAARARGRRRSSLQLLWTSPGTTRVECSPGRMDAGCQEGCCIARQPPREDGTPVPGPVRP